MGARNLGQMLRASCSEWQNKAAMLVPEGDGFREITYRELWKLVRGYATALQSLGLQAGDRLAIQSENCYQWAILDWACQTLGVVVVPVYPTLPADQSRYIVEDSAARVVVTGSAHQAEKMAGLAELTVVPLTGEGSVEESATKALSSGENLLDETSWSAGIDAISPESVATMIYTSGTTGQPKGAMLPHRAPMFLCERIPESLPIDHNDLFLSFLPMSHVFERVAGQFLPISCGATVAYSRSLMSLASDIQRVRPTIMLCVPRFLEATRDRILDNAKKRGGLQRVLFEWTLAQGVRRAQGKFAPLAPLLDRMVGSKIRERLGGRIRFLVSGGAALAPHVAEFYIAFGLKVLQGYGLTETSAATCVNHPDRSKYWTVGEPIPGVEVKVAEDGEICVRGPSVMLGYHNLPDETAKAIDADGWFHTGDIGEWEGAHLKITDRKKDLLILANGKNVAPQPIENKLRESPWISEAVLFGDGAEFVYALIVPHFERLAARLHASEPPPSSNERIVANPEVRKLIKEAVDAVNATLADFEKVKKWELASAAFSVEAGELTPTLKVRRKVVRERYAALLKGLERP